MTDANLVEQPNKIITVFTVGEKQFYFHCMD